MMSLGEDFAVVCLECIAQEGQRARVLTTLRRSFAEIIEISLEQVEQHFCGNILAVQNELGQRLIVMSRRAFHGFTAAQRERLSHRGEIVACDIATIEAIGGGSARCMMAEIFSPRLPVP
jgi:hypothetical protein